MTPVIGRVFLALGGDPPHHAPEAQGEPSGPKATEGAIVKYSCKDKEKRVRGFREREERRNDTQMTFNTSQYLRSSEMREEAEKSPERAMMAFAAETNRRQL